MEFNIEGDPRPDFVELVAEVRPDQCTLVPVRPGEITSQAGWSADTRSAALAAAIERCRAAGVRVSLFVDPEDEPVRWAGSTGAQRVELYTEPFARAFEAGPAAAPRIVRPSTPAPPAWPRRWGSRSTRATTSISTTWCSSARLPHLAEVSIGHALVSHALFVGLERSVRDYLSVLAG